MCEAFSCLPSEIERERLRLPDGLLEQVLEARAYERAHGYLQAQPKGPKTGMVALAEQVMFAIVQEDMDAKKT